MWELSLTEDYKLIGPLLLCVTLSKLTITPRAQMGYESIAHEAEGRMGYRLRRHEDERNNCFSKMLNYPVCLAF